MVDVELGVVGVGEVGFEVVGFAGFGGDEDVFGLCVCLEGYYFEGKVRRRSTK